MEFRRKIGGANFMGADIPANSIRGDALTRQRLFARAPQRVDSIWFNLSAANGKALGITS